jgi:RNA-directed DNA polymerase
MFDFHTIYKAYMECKRNKSNTINAMKFEQNLIENLWDLSHQLKCREYQIGTSICFLTHSPKLREIFAADFRDRVVHHLLIREIEEFYERKFIYDVYSNRKGKGTHKAVERSKKFMRANRAGYYLQLDIKGFFYNLDKQILFKKLVKDIESSDLKEYANILWLAYKIIFHDPTKNYHFQGNPKHLDTLPSPALLLK